MPNKFFKKGLVVGIIILFVGVSVLSSVSSKDISISDDRKIENNKETEIFDNEIKYNSLVEPLPNDLKYKDYKDCSIRAKEGVDGKAFLFPGFFSSWPESDSNGIDVERAFGILIRVHVICPCYGIYFNNDYYYSNWTKAYVFSFTGYFYNYFYGPWRIFEIDGTAKFVRVYYS
jgi:hypothetical protein